MWNDYKKVKFEVLNLNVVEFDYPFRFKKEFLIDGVKQNTIKKFFSSIYLVSLIFYKKHVKF